jgi:Icc protein
VVCGHTHGGGAVDVLPNLRVLTGAADYGFPAAQAPLVLDAAGR